MTEYLVSTKNATGLIVTNENGIIISPAPIWNRYRGRKFFDFIKEQNKYGEVRCHTLKEKK